jgi:hypothetical protein
MRTGGVPRQRKPVRAFTGLVGLPPEPASQSLPPAPHAVESASTVEGLMAGIILGYDKRSQKKRGRPRKHLDSAAKQAAYREKKSDKDKRLAAEKAIRDEIDAVLWEHRDRNGELPGESSGGDVIGRVEHKVEQGRLNGGRRLGPSGASLKILEDVPWKSQKRETDETWANRQNFYAMSKWHARDVEVFTKDLIDIICRKNGPDFCCGLCAFADAWRPNTVRHIIESHQKFIRREVRRCRPRPLKARIIVTGLVKTTKGV